MVARPLLLSFVLALAACVAGDDLGEAECLRRAAAQVLRAPDKEELFVTTSRLYKQQLAEFFCARGSGQLAALELGIYHGHTTAVLAAIFQKVISVDIEESYVKTAANHTREQANVVFLAADLTVDSWRAVRSNPVDVAIIDANHKYESVRVDAHNALRYLSPLAYVVFDDFGHEAGVQRTVKELQRSGALGHCHGIGQGWDGQPWKFQNWDEATGQSFQDWTNVSEGVICKKGLVAESTQSPAGFVNQRFYVYPQPIEYMQHRGIFRLHAGGRLETSWGDGSWISLAGKLRDALQLELPGMARTPLELRFNWPRTAFLLMEAGTLTPLWLGIRDSYVHQPFELATEQFDGFA